MLRHRRASQRVRDAPLLGRFRLPHTTARLGVRGGFGCGVGCYHSGGHFKEFAGRDGKPGEVVEERITLTPLEIVALRRSIML